MPIIAVDRLMDIEKRLLSVKPGITDFASIVFSDEAEILKDAEYFHIFYGGYDGTVWAIGHVRTRDFHSFEPNPHNPIFTPSPDPEAWDSDGLLTPQVFTINGVYYMIYAGLKGSGWNRVSAVQTGLAVAKPT